ncbi:hypothetical protein [Caudoviricetes sp.]|nr:hypothetical protein [Caudoviricetes sp.]
MDEYPEVPITEHSCFVVNIEGVGEFTYSPASDAIHIFDDDRMNHVKYWDEEKRCIVYQFLGNTVLEYLSECGVPCVPRANITPAEHTHWCEYESKMESLTLDDEINELLGNDLS